jgi:hypothetical protein
VAGEPLEALPITDFDQAAHLGKNTKLLKELDGLGYGGTPNSE